MGGKKIQARSSKLEELSITFPYNFLEGLQLGQNEFIIEKLLGKLLFSLLFRFCVPLHRTRIRKKTPL
jgi:hypothetical protein